jgi:S-adenosylhomocysteine hydrolase
VEEAASQGEILATATGRMDVIRGGHMAVMKDEARHTHAFAPKCANA